MPKKLSKAELKAIERFNEALGKCWHEHDAYCAAIQALSSQDLDDFDRFVLRTRIEEGIYAEDSED